MVKTVDKLVNGQKIKAKKVNFLVRIIITLLLMGSVFLFAAIITYVSTHFKATPVKSYSECTKARGSIIQKTYPGVCISKSGDRFVQPLSEQEEKLPSPPVATDPEGTFCGGIMGKACPEGYGCKLEGNYPDAGGKCIKN